jgi:hypothetical protein
MNDDCGQDRSFSIGLYVDYGVVATTAGGVESNALDPYLL